MSEGSIWKVGNGSKIRNWTNLWLDFGVLLQFAITNLTKTDKSRLVNSYLQNGVWDVQCLKEVLLQAIVDKILSVFMDATRPVDDEII